MDSKGKATDEEMEREREQEQNPNCNINNNELGEELQVDEEEMESNSGNQQHEEQQASRTRTPFTNLSQVDADLALARTLQEQERAYMMLMMNNNVGSDYGSLEAGSYLHEEDDDFGGDVDEDDDDDENDGDDLENHELDGSDVDVDEDEDEDDEDEDAFDVHARDEVEEDNNPIVEYDSDVFSSDEAYARALQDAEERDMASRLLALAGINDREIEDTDDHSDHSQDTWEEIDPDELSYEELLALGEVIGTESRGLSTDTIASLPTINYKAETSQNGSNDSCVICRLDYEDSETLTVLSCKHSYHSECINNWLKINKVCPVCSAEVSTSGHS